MKALRILPMYLRLLSVPIFVPGRHLTLPLMKCLRNCLLWVHHVVLLVIDGKCSRIRLNVSMALTYGTYRQDL